MSEKLETAGGRIHTLYIDDRQSLVVTGVKDVGSFSEEEVLITLEEGGGLVIKGEQLHMIQLDREEGRAEFSGRIHSAVYTQKRRKEASLWARLWK